MTLFHCLSRAFCTHEMEARYRVRKGEKQRRESRRRDANRIANFIFAQAKRSAGKRLLTRSAGDMDRACFTGVSLRFNFLFQSLGSAVWRVSRRVELCEKLCPCPRSTVIADYKRERVRCTLTCVVVWYPIELVEAGDGSQSADKCSGPAQYSVPVYFAFLYLLTLVLVLMLARETLELLGAERLVELVNVVQNIQNVITAVHRLCVVR